ncbi:hypothetical protein AB9F26_13460 [Falsihalocynthiibacter sp. BN13B15]|uniref:hypothetical protein n=1 Tax=Falsihalocynthiibacter sp. BN13B15 TaxID=3240871 RepID=UPI003510C09C
MSEGQPELFEGLEPREPVEERRLRKRCEHQAKSMKDSVKAGKQDARNAVNKAVAFGDLVRPKCCAHCGKFCVPEGHHWSYLREQWLDVEWLCKGCHVKVHLEPDIDPRQIDWVEDLSGEGDA